MSAPLRHLLVAVDGSDCSIAAIHYALRLAGSAGRVTFTNAINLGAAIDAAVTPAGGDPTIVLDALDAERRRVYDVASRLARTAGVSAETIDASGPVVDAITGLASRIGADAIVVGTHGRRGLARAVLGSVANGVLRRATVPTFVVHAGDDDAEADGAPPIRRIVVDIEGDGRITPQIELALDLAAMQSARIFFVHLTVDADESTVDRQQNDALRIAADWGVDYDVVRGSGNASDAVLNVTTLVGADLIVVGSHEHEHDPGRFLRGSFCETVVRSSPIPVAVAHGTLAARARGAAVLH